MTTDATPRTPGLERERNIGRLRAITIGRPFSAITETDWEEVQRLIALLGAAPAEREGREIARGEIPAMVASIPRRHLPYALAILRERAESEGKPPQPTLAATPREQGEPESVHDPENTPHDFREARDGKCYHCGGEAGAQIHNPFLARTDAPPAPGELRCPLCSGYWVPVVGQRCTGCGEYSETAEQSERNQQAMIERAAPTGEAARLADRDAARIEWILREYPEIATWDDVDGWVDQSMLALARRIRGER